MAVVEERRNKTRERCGAKESRQRYLHDEEREKRKKMRRET